MKAADAHAQAVESLYLEACHLYSRERAEILRPLLEQLAKDMTLFSRLPLNYDEEP